METDPAPRRRRRAATNELVTIFWRDIPAQVTAATNGEKGSWLLEDRFQLAIDRAAGVSGLTGADDYVSQMRRVSQPCHGDPNIAAKAEAERLQEMYTSARVRELVDNGGLEPGSIESGSIEPGSVDPSSNESPSKGLHHD